MSTWPIFYLILWWVAVGAAVVALIALPFIYRRGMRQIDQAMTTIFDDRDQRQSVTNVRALSRWELARRMEKRNRNGGDVA